MSAAPVSQDSSKVTLEQGPNSFSPRSSKNMSISMGEVVLEQYDDLRVPKESKVLKFSGMHSN